ncbi:MAG: hypothetical protein ACRCYS_04185 [Beijerinckiaceae bacterium]
MSEWKIAMLAALPLMTAGPKLRTWLALMGAAAAATIVPTMTLGPNVDSVVIGWYISIDALAGWVVLRHPAGWVQKFIGAAFALMVSFHVGFLIADRPAATLDYLHWLAWAGWVQWAALAGWGVHDVGKGASNRLRAWRNAPVAGAGL